MTGSVKDVLGFPSVTAVGARAISTTTPCQLDGFLHGAETDQDESTSGGRHNTMVLLLD